MTHPCACLTARQVIFMNNPVTGLVVIAAATFNSYYYCLMGMLGLVCSTVTAITLGFNDGIIIITTNASRAQPSFVCDSLPQAPFAPAYSVIMAISLELRLLSSRRAGATRSGTPSW